MDGVVIEDADLGALPGAADGARVLEPLLRSDERPAALSGPVVLVDHRTEPGEHAALHVHRTRRRGVKHVRERGDVVAFAFAAARGYDAPGQLEAMDMESIDMAVPTNREHRRDPIA